MSKIHFCLLCHTEGRAEDINTGLSAMLELREKVEKQTGKRFPLTWMLGTYHFKDPEKHFPAVFDEHRETFKQLLKQNDEIGLHPHGYPDENNVMLIDPFIINDTKALINAGFPKPNTIVVGTWSFYKSTLNIIEKEGYVVDSSVAGGKLVQNGVTIYEYPPEDELHPVWRRPYRMSRENVMRSGNSGVIEIPASGHLIEFAKGVNEELVWEFFKHHISKRFEMRWEHRNEQPVDVFEVFWHPFEVIKDNTKGSLNKELLDRFEAFLIEISKWDDVEFSTVYDAAMDWSR